MSCTIARNTPGLHRHRRKLGVAAATLTVGIAIAGCSAATPEADKLSITTTTGHVADFTRAIAGDEAEVAQLLEPGQSAHSFDPGALALDSLRNADVLVINGAGLEGWLDDAVEASGFSGTLIEASADVHLISHGAHDETQASEHSAHDHDHDHDHASEHGATDPHIWSDPHQAMHMVETITTGLIAADAPAAEAYRAGADAYLKQLEALDSWVAESIAQVPEAGRLLVTTHDTFAYLAKAQHITVVGNVVASLDDNAEPSAAEMDALIARIRDTGVRAVYAETSVNPALTEAIARDAGVEIFAGEDGLYADALGHPGSPGETYIGSQIHNITLMMESWGGNPVELPEVLQGQ